MASDSNVGVDAEGFDPGKSIHIAVVGKKRTGKTELAWHLFSSYPYDRLLIDPAGDIQVPETTLELSVPIPGHWPRQAAIDNAAAKVAGNPPKFHTLRFVPDFKSDTYLDDIDRAAGLAYINPRTMLMVDEAHEAIPASRTPPHCRRILRQARHAPMSVIWSTPRPMTVDPLMITQADYVYIFKLPGPSDRKRVAECIGWTPKEFDQAIFALGPHEYLLYKDGGDDGEGELLHYPALPADVIVGHKST